MDSREDARDRLAAIGEIAAEVAHELRNALQIISANVYLAKQDPASSAPQLGKIERSARLCHGIVDDLMGLARGEAANATPVFLAEVMLASREALPDPGAEFDDRLTPKDLRVRVHPGLFARLLHVLYENAVGAKSPERPTIITTASKADGRVIVDVTDDGPGVPVEVAATLFEPLVSARKGGTGLGLALARRVVAAHGGTITLVPRPEGESGATFRVELPS